jgi:molybdopterin synthase catalytic subunit
MSIHIQIVDGPLSKRAPDWPDLPTGEVGAAACFEGIVRRHEGDALIDALDYTAYEPMAPRELGRLAGELVREFGLAGMYVEHSRGRVPVGACSFRLRVASAHRAEALRAAERFIDRMKRDVPIWKAPVPAGHHDHASDPPHQNDEQAVRPS